MFVSLTRGRLLGSSIRVRPDEFPAVVDTVERLARAIDVVILSVIFHAVNVTVGSPAASSPLPGMHTKLPSLNFADIKAYVQGNAWLWFLTPPASSRSRAARSG